MMYTLNSNELPSDAIISAMRRAIVEYMAMRKGDVTLKEKARRAGYYNGQRMALCHALCVALCYESGDAVPSMAGEEKWQELEAQLGYTKEF
jgi:hypothetical protein